MFAPLVRQTEALGQNATMTGPTLVVTAKATIYDDWTAEERLEMTKRLTAKIHDVIYEETGVREVSDVLCSISEDS